MQVTRQGEADLDGTRAAGEPETRRGNARTTSARELLGPSGLLHIDLDGEIYTLRLTRNNRLILTK